MSEPIVRIVRMTFHPDQMASFLALFKERQRAIEATEGCRGVQLVRDIRFPNIAATISRWDSEDHLESYRKSRLFKETWRLTKVLFAAPPEAFTYREPHQLQSENIRPADMLRPGAGSPS